MAARRATLLWVAAFVATGLILARLAYLTLTNKFAPYDDEGYMMLTIREFLDRGALYDETYSQYGPFFAQFWAAVVEVFGLPLNHNYARGLVLVLWLATSGLLGASIWRMTRSGALGLLTTVVAFGALTSLANESLHPGSLTCVLLAAIVAVIAFVLPDRPRLAAGLIGALLAALLLVKINVGGLAVLATLLAAAMALPGLPARRAARIGIAGLVLITPLVLMAGDLDKTWTTRYLAVVLAGTAALVVAAWPTDAEDLPGSHNLGLRWLATAGAAFAATAAAICAVALVTGTSLSGLVEGILLDPLKHPDIFEIPLSISSGSVDVVLVGLGAAIVATRVTRLSAGAHGAISLAAGALILWSIADPSLSGLFEDTGLVQFTVALALAWVAVLPLREEVDPLRRFGIVFVVALAVLQTLHAYPVAGSQVDFSTFLLAPVGALCLAQAWSLFPRPSRLAQITAVLVGVVAVKVALGGVIEPLQAAERDHDANVSLALQGADRVRVPAATRDTYRALAFAINDNCSTLLTLPGLNSLYLLTGQEPPTGYNAGDWMFLFDTETQQQVVDAVAGGERVCVVRNDTQLNNWAGGQTVPDRPLYRYVTTGVRPIGEFGEFKLLRKGAP